MSFTVALVTRDTERQRELSEQLAAHGHDVVLVDDVGDLDAARMSAPADVVLLDLEPHHHDEVENVRALRECCSLPVMVVAARIRDRMRESVLLAGADDYIARPMARTQLLSRLRALARGARETPVLDEAIEVGPLRIEPGTRAATFDGRNLALTGLEHRVLVALARHADQVLSLDALARAAWGPRARRMFDSVRAYVSVLRKKIEIDPSRPRWLVTSRGIGYCLLSSPAT